MPLNVFSIFSFFFAVEKVSLLMNLYLESGAIIGVYIMMELCIVFNRLKPVFLKARGIHLIFFVFTWLFLSIFGGILNSLIILDFIFKWVCFVGRYCHNFSSFLICEKLKVAFSATWKITTGFASPFRNWIEIDWTV